FRIVRRESDQAQVRMLEVEKGGNVGGVLHCVWGDEALARGALELGFCIGVGWPVTLKKSDALRQTLQGVPVERLIVETDATYLAPVPYRGKRNEPSYVVETAKQLAALKGLDLEELARITTENARRLFRIELNQTA